MRNATLLVPSNSALSGDIFLHVHVIYEITIFMYQLELYIQDFFCSQSQALTAH